MEPYESSIIISGLIQNGLVTGKDGAPHLTAEQNADINEDMMSVNELTNWVQVHLIVDANRIENDAAIHHIRRINGQSRGSEQFEREYLKSEITKYADELDQQKTDIEKALTAAGREDPDEVRVETLAADIMVCMDRAGAMTHDIPAGYYAGKLLVDRYPLAFEDKSEQPLFSLEAIVPDIIASEAYDNAIHRLADSYKALPAGFYPDKADDAAFETRKTQDGLLRAIAHTYEKRTEGKIRSYVSEHYPVGEKEDDIDQAVKVYDMIHYEIPALYDEAMRNDGRFRNLRGGISNTFQLLTMQLPPDFATRENIDALVDDYDHAVTLNDSEAYEVGLTAAEKWFSLDGKIDFLDLSAFDSVCSDALEKEAEKEAKVHAVEYELADLDVDDDWAHGA
jgi:hypothetical protein